MRRLSCPFYGEDMIHEFNGIHIILNIEFGSE